jgi:predicted amidohydrolase
MAITICLDYFVPERTDLLVKPNVNLIFVPAMSPRLSRMKQANFDSGTLGLASVFFANNCWIITGGKIDKFEKEHSSFIYTPKIGGLIQTVCTGDCGKCNFPILRISELFNKKA